MAVVPAIKAPQVNLRKSEFVSQVYTSPLSSRASADPAAFGAASPAGAAARGLQNIGSLVDARLDAEDEARARLLKVDNAYDAQVAGLDANEKMKQLVDEFSKQGDTGNIDYVNSFKEKVQAYSVSALERAAQTGNNQDVHVKIAPHINAAMEKINAGHFAAKNTKIHELVRGETVKIADFINGTGKEVDINEDGTPQVASLESIPTLLNALMEGTRTLYGDLLPLEGMRNLEVKAIEGFIQFYAAGAEKQMLVQPQLVREKEILSRLQDYVLMNDYGSPDTRRMFGEIQQSIRSKQEVMSKGTFEEQNAQKIKEIKATAKAKVDADDALAEAQLARDEARIDKLTKKYTTLGVPALEALDRATARVDKFNVARSPAEDIKINAAKAAAEGGEARKTQAAVPVKSETASLSPGQELVERQDDGSYKVVASVAAAPVKSETTSLSQGQELVERQDDGSYKVVASVAPAPVKPDATTPSSNSISAIANKLFAKTNAAGETVFDSEQDAREALAVGNRAFEIFTQEKGISEIQAVFRAYTERRPAVTGTAPVGTAPVGTAPVGTAPVGTGAPASATPSMTFSQERAMQAIEKIDADAKGRPPLKSLDLRDTTGLTASARNLYNNTLGQIQGVKAFAEIPEAQTALKTATLEVVRAFAVNMEKGRITNQDAEFARKLVGHPGVWTSPATLTGNLNQLVSLVEKKMREAKDEVHNGRLLEQNVKIYSDLANAMQHLQQFADSPNVSVLWTKEDIDSGKISPESLQKVLSAPGGVAMVRRLPEDVKLAVVSSVKRFQNPPISEAPVSGGKTAVASAEKKSKAVGEELSGERKGKVKK